MKQLLFILLIFCNNVVFAEHLSGIELLKDFL